MACRKTRRGRKERLASKDKLTVRARQQDICFGWRVNPGCTYWLVDAHELISQGRGGPQESWNRVGVCRNCHTEAQGRVGGNRLLFDWPGKADGRKPNADEPWNVGCYWRDRKRGVQNGEGEDIPRVQGCCGHLLHRSAAA